MNFNNVYVFLDLETTGKNPNTAQPTELAAVAICNRKLEIKPNGIFRSLIKPIMDDKLAIEKGLEPVTDEVLKITHLTREELEAAPLPGVVMTNFELWLKQFAKSKNDWDQPIMCGYNIENYDKIIIDRLSQEFGYYDKEYKQSKLFHPLHKIDIMRFMYMFTENMKINTNNSMSMDSIREWLKINKDMAHSAVKDVLDGAYLMTKIIRFYRHAAKELIEWEGCFEKENDLIVNHMKVYVK